ncbi:glycoside hydrolase family 9 protein [Aquimarina sp. 2201CG14-23]|uniref:glycoside hydrolase family 9 protein n=1 Tax=Aquimarina mycalae TaxID=3040073 RepID=UPI002477F918|nr:glycoside hydrolase family 9 protein [Aquimarina sp. 2201CG14-23]MDH7445496.1 glycoside hydrolase family 9 protein [Aquimarina sp. 2201CG14-23]
MKKLQFLLLITSIIGVHVQGQITYSDNFDEGILKIDPTTAYTPSLSNNNLSISGNGTAGAYAAFTYQIHNSGTNTNINIASAPKLFIKAKGSSIPDLRIDLQDQNDYVTNLSAQSINLSDEFQIFELDYTGKLEDGGYGGPCAPASAPCPVDAAMIKNLVMFVNAATGGYTGTIEIDWISFGEPLEAIPPPSEYDIRYNQVSYLKGKDKLINIVAKSSFTSKSYTIYDSSDNVITNGSTGASVLWSDSGEHVTVVDISSIDAVGTYRFAIDEMEIFFDISNDGYEEVREQAFKYYYYNRASTEITATYAGAYARNLGHPDNQVIVHSSAASATRPTGTIISSPKGWYDAGDYNKYIVNSGISTYTLLAAYEHYSTYYQDVDFTIPEQGGDIPDILDETIWNLDWMLTMQDPNDGGVYHKLTGLNFSGNVMPDQYTFDRYVVQKTTSAALNFAAVTAIASRLFANFEAAKPGYSTALLQASKNAYAWAKANPAVYYNQPSDVQTGEYGDNNVIDELQWAAVELFITTDEAQYKNDIDIGQIGNGTPSWQYTAPLALISIAHHTSNLTGDIDVTAANNKLLSSADQLKNTVNTSPMQIAMNTSDYNWGSNGSVGNQLVILIRAYELTNDSSYLDAAYKAMDYIFGRNGTGYSYVTGFGDNKVLDPHHRISVADNVAFPVPGMIVGGPHSGQQDGCSGYPNNNPASSFVDDYCSYSTNEVTINWNAPLVYSLHALHFYQNESLTLSIDTFEETSEKFKIFPNPIHEILNIKFLASTSSSNMEIYSIQGKKVFSKILNDSESKINIGNLPSGFYLVKIKGEGRTYATKIIKE